MKNKLLILILCILAVSLTGCLSGGGSASPDGSGGSILGGGGDSGILGGGVFEYTPEPATALLLGAGLVAYAFLKRKKKK